MKLNEKALITFEYQYAFGKFLYSKFWKIIINKINSKIK